MKKLIPKFQKGNLIERDNTNLNNVAQDKIFGVQRHLDSQNMSDEDFSNRYQTSKRAYQMRDSDYAQAMKRQMDIRKQQDPNYSELNLPQTDVRSKLYKGNPNLAFIPKGATGEGRALQEDMFLGTTTVSAPLLPLKSVKPVTSLVKNSINDLGSYLTTQTPLKNAYKLNPYAFKTNPQAYYRTLGKEGFEDALSTGSLRARVGGDGKEQVLGINMSRPSDVPYFAKGEIGNYPGNDIVAETVKPLYKRGDLNPITGNQIKGRHWGYRNINKEGLADNLPIEDVNFLQKNWLKGYKKIDVPSNQSNQIQVSNQDIVSSGENASFKIHRNHPNFLKYQERKNNLKKDIHSHMLDYYDRKMGNPQVYERLRNLGLNDKDIELGQEIFKTIHVSLKPKPSNNYGTMYHYGDFIFDEAKRNPNIKDQLIKNHPLQMNINPRSNLVKKTYLNDDESYQRTLRSTVWHELDHGFTGSFGVNEKINNLINNAKVNYKPNELKKLAYRFHSDSKDMNEAINNVNYLKSPTEVYSRIGELRSFLDFPLKDGVYVKSTGVNTFIPHSNRFNLHLGYHIPKLRELFNTLPTISLPIIGTSKLTNE